MDEDQRDDRDQHQKAAHLGEDEVLDRRVHALLVTPDGDQEIKHPDQHHLEEEVEQEQVEREEHAGEPRHGPDDHQWEDADVAGDAAP